MTSTTDHDPEAGPFSDSHQARTPRRTMTSSTIDIDSHDDLAVFQELLGITSHGRIGKEITVRPTRSLSALFYSTTAVNEGYYKRAIDEELKASLGYHFSATVIAATLVLQIFIAATITALGASNNHRIAVTILGALNTAMAGTLAYLKGQGLPNRLLQSRNQFHRVREYCEYKERQFEIAQVMQDRGEHPPVKLDPFKEAEQVKAFYDVARKDAQDNYPDSYINNAEKNELSEHPAGNRENAHESTEGRH